MCHSETYLHPDTPLVRDNAAAMKNHTCIAVSRLPDNNAAPMTKVYLQQVIYIR
jgi:hypothetical protein